MEGTMAGADEHDEWRLHVKKGDLVRTSQKMPCGPRGVVYEVLEMRGAPAGSPGWRAAELAKDSDGVTDVTWLEPVGKARVGDRVLLKTSLPAWGYSMEGRIGTVEVAPNGVNTAVVRVDRKAFDIGASWSSFNIGVSWFDVIASNASDEKDDEKDGKASAEAKDLNLLALPERFRAITDENERLARARDQALRDRETDRVSFEKTRDMLVKERDNANESMEHLRVDRNRLKDALGPKGGYKHDAVFAVLSGGKDDPSILPGHEWWSEALGAARRVVAERDEARQRATLAEKKIADFTLPDGSHGCAWRGAHEQDAQIKARLATEREQALSALAHSDAKLSELIRAAETRPTCGQPCALTSFKGSSRVRRVVNGATGVVGRILRRQGFFAAFVTGLGALMSIYGLGIAQGRRIEESRRVPPEVAPVASASKRWL